MTEKFDWIALDLIDEDVSNHRLLVDPAADDALLASIQANGVQQPIKLARKKEGRYTLVFGFRRTAMAKKAGLDRIPALVVNGLTATEIRSLQAIENLERKELHPMEEAQFCQDLHDTLDPENHGGAYLPELIAQRVGRSVKWVENRLALSRLSPRVKKCFMDGDIQLQHAQLIGRLVSHDAQEEVLGRVKAQTYDFLTGRERIEGKDPAKTIRETRQLVEARLRDLSGVNWKLDAEFVGMPACTACSHNSANRLDLFDGDAPKRPQCLNAPCFQLKTKEAGLAVRRASNTLAKTEEKYTPTTARKAMKERAVEFVVEKAVVEAAKHKMPSQKSSGAGATKAENNGRAKQERKNKIEAELRERMRKWLTPLTKTLDAKHAETLKNPIATAMIALLVLSEIVEVADRAWGGKKKQEAARMQLRKVVQLLKEPTAVHLVTVAELLHSQIKDYHEVEHFGINDYYDSPFLRQQLCELYGVTPDGERPTFEAVERELFPAPEPKTGKKVRGKKKAKVA